MTASTGSSSPSLLAGRVLAAALMGAAGAIAAPPVISSYPAISTSTVVANNSTQYTLTTTVTDADGHNDIRCIRLLFNYNEADGVSSRGRGYMSWGVTDADATQYGGTWVMADATGGGRWGYRTDDWGGTTWWTPLSVAITNAGQATGGSGSRTLVCTFKAKPAWAFNPLVNDADIWVADYAASIGWRDNPNSFDVVSAACTSTSATPRAPVVSSPTTSTLNVAIHPQDSSTDLFAIKVSPDSVGRPYVQPNGALGPAPAWQTRSGWGTITVRDLMWSTTYSISVRAARNIPGTCPSDFGPAATASTAELVPTVNAGAGTAFSPWVRGQCPYRMITQSGYETLWDMTAGASGRGLAGGLDADTYDWRDIYSGSNWGQGGGRFTTLEFLRYARDHDVAPLLTANAYGGGAKDPVSGTFVCQYVNPEGLAADWVRYANTILPQYRQGQEAQLTGDELRVYDAIAAWDGRPRLLSASEAVTPKVQYWEIGNEPELGGFGGFLDNHHLDANGYRDRYRTIAQAMLAVDPTIKLGPCLMDPADGSGAWLDALAADPGIPVDFVGYHPYYSLVKWAWGDPLSMTAGLRGVKAHLHGKHVGIRARMDAAGRTNYALMATEWNPMNWDASSEQQRSMAMALGIAESVFTFAEDDVLGAHFWEQPQAKLSARHVFEGLRDYMGDILLTSPAGLGIDPAQANWRLYVTRDQQHPDRIAIWGLNFHEHDPLSLDLRLGACRVTSAMLRRYGRPGDDASGGDTSLMTSTGYAWTQQDVTSGFDPKRFTLVMEDAEVTLLALEVVPVARPDLDRDGDVDQEDFGRFQACLSGANIAQPRFECIDARLDPDGDVDAADFLLFQECFSGAGIDADPHCAP